MRWSIKLLLLVLWAVPASQSVQAQSCTRDQFRKIVDDTGAVLRRINAEQRQRLETGLKRLKDKYGWSEEDYLEKTNSLLSDSRSEAYDTAATDLLGKLDRLAEDAPSGQPDCSKLGELEATGLELQATVRVKTQYLLSRLDQLTGEQPKAQAPQPAPAKKDIAAAASQLPPQPITPLREALPSPSPTAPPLAKPIPPKAPPAIWSTNTVEDKARIPAPASDNTAPPSVPRPMPTLPVATDGFSQDEIREATRGFFGTVSSNLASVIEYSFSKLGRPTAYVLGNEGGGAFIAGVRYGRGTIFTRGGKSRELHWHGPSIGYDFGASGSKALFLVYNLRDELDIFTGFSGVEGSAYLVGGVGMTVLTNGSIVMAPIRSGVGLRFGASLGYIRFTARPTWNPF